MHDALNNINYRKWPEVAYYSRIQGETRTPSPENGDAMLPAQIRKPRVSPVYQLLPSCSFLPLDERVATLFGLLYISIIFFCEDFLNITKTTKSSNNFSYTTLGIWMHFILCHFFQCYFTCLDNSDESGPFLIGRTASSGLLTFRYKQGM